MIRGTLHPVALTLTLALGVGVAGCSTDEARSAGEPSKVTEPSADPSPEPADAGEERELTDAIAGPVPLDQVADEMIRLLLADLPIDDDTMAAIQDAGAQVDALAAAASETAGAAPHGFGSVRAPTDSPVLATAGQGFAAVIGLVGQTIDRAIQDRPVTSTDPDGRIELADGRLDATLRASGTSVQGNATATLTTEITVDTMLCPDAAGAVQGDIESHATLELALEGGTVTAVVDMQLALDATADDAATLTTVGHETTGGFAQTMQGSANGRSGSAGIYVEVGTEAEVGVGGEAWDVRKARAHTIRSSKHSSLELDRAYQEVLVKLATIVATQVARDAERYWQSGACVDVRMNPADGPSDLEPGQQVAIEIDPVSKVDAAPTGGDVVARLVDGGEAVAPDGTALAAPGTVTYTAPADGGGTVEAVATSRRGIGRGTLQLETGAQGWVVEGSDGVFDVYGVKCGAPGGSWTFELSAEFDGGTFTGDVVADLDPDSLTGTYELTGTWAGGPVTLAQTGSGPIRFIIEGPDNARLEFESTGWSSGSAAGGWQGVGSIPARPAGPDDC